MSFDKQDYGRFYSEQKLWQKLKHFASRLGRDLLLMALKLYYTLGDKETPVWAKSTIVTALGYLILPIDVVPDVIPVVGYGDDAAMLAAALAAVAAHVKPEHVRRAEATLASWL